MKTVGFPVRVNPHALALDAFGAQFDELVAAGDLSPYRRYVDTLRDELGQSSIVHAEPDEAGTYSLFNRQGVKAWERIPESTFVRVPT